jgi:hypothetical protein
MNTRLACLPALCALATLASCSTVSPTQRHDGRFRETRSWRDPLVSAEVFYGEHELDEIEFDRDLEEIFGPGIDDVERKRAGVRIAVGVDNIQGYVQLFGEEIDDFDASQLNAGTSLTLDDLFGVGVGIRGEPVLNEVGPHTKLLAPYRLGINIVTGEGRFNDSNAGTLLKSASERGDFAYIEEEIQAGLGFDVHGFRTTVGVYATLLAGTVEDDIVTDDDDDDLDFEAFNPGLFAELRYKHPHFPLMVGVRATGGDVQGLEGFLGIVL